MAVSARSSHIHSLLTKGRLLHFKKDDEVFSTNDNNHVMMVKQGYVKRYFISSDGSLGVQIVYGPEDIFPLTNVYDLLLGQSLYDGPETYYYQAMCPVQLYMLDIASFTEAAQTDPQLYKELFSEAGHHLRTCVHSIENISLGNAHARVAHQLLFFVKEFGMRNPEGIGLAVPLTHQDIADILGVTRETVTKAIIQLRQQGILDQARRFSVLDLAGLERAAYA